MTSSIPPGGASSSIPPPDASHCSLYLKHKKRYCRFPRVTGHEHCSHHITARRDDDENKERIPCPLDASHSIYARDLNRHLKICPKAKAARAEAALACFRRDVNASVASAEAAANAAAAMATTEPALAEQAQPSTLAPALLGAVPPERVHALLDLVRKAYTAHASRVAPPLAAVASSFSAEDGRGRKTEKHGKQHAAMLQVLSSRGQLDDGCTYIELGAGKGGLSLAVSEAASRASYVLVDWAKPQNSVDASLRERGVRCARYKIDLRHFWMRGVPELWPSPPAEAPAAKAPAEPQAAAEAAAGAAAGAAAEAAAEAAADAAAPNDSLPSSLGGITACGACELTSDSPATASALSPATASIRRVGIAKHLCGCATDFALRSIVSAAAGTGATGCPPALAASGGAVREGLPLPATAPAMAGVMIATCCHHKCTWASYCNQPFLRRLGLGEQDFQLLTLLSSWATNGGGGGGGRSGGGGGSSGGGGGGGGSGGSGGGSGSTVCGASSGGRAVSVPAAPADEPQDEHASADPEALRLGDALSARFDAASRRELGRMCKRLLDTGRLHYLEAHGYSARLQAYVEESVSPENTLLLAEPAAPPPAHPTLAEDDGAQQTKRVRLSEALK